MTLGTNHIPLPLAGGADIPDQPGVYLFVNDADIPLYIGKAISLRSRVRQYLSGHDTRPLIPLMLGEAAAVRFIIVRDGTEALILENRLIKKHRPRYNIDLKDDKSYPYLAFTREQFPLLIVTRKPHRTYRYIRGPFTDVKLLRRFRRALLACYPLRRCLKLPKKACINYQLGLCPAPCESHISAADYDRRVKQVVALIEGRGWQEFGATLTAELGRAAAELRFEKAAELRDILQLLPELKKRFGIDPGRDAATDAFYFSFDRRRLSVTVGRYEEGTITELYHFGQKMDDDEKSAAARAVASFYEHRDPADTVAIHPDGLLDADILGGILERPVRIAALPAAAWTLLARNHAHDKERLVRSGATDPLALEKLAALTKSEVTSIVCLDISTLHGAHTIAGAVWWEAGNFVTKLYRRFTMKSVVGQNDFASIAEAVGRFRVHWEAGDWPAPSLLLIDGGLPQLRAAGPALLDLSDAEGSGVEWADSTVPLLGIVKDRRKDRGGEKLVTPAGAEIPLGDDPLSLLLKRLRDEAHRFSITANRAARRKDIGPLFGNIPGIGPARERALLEQFGTVERIRMATREELSAVPGLTTRTAEALWENLHGKKG